MRFGIVNHEEEVALEKENEEKAQKFSGLRVGIVKKHPPTAAEREKLAIWILESLGIVNGVEDDHPAVIMLIELINRRKKGLGISGSEITSLTKIGKTQTYYWLNKMKEAGIVDQGKKKMIEHGAIRTLSGFYLTGPNMSYTIADIKKRVEESFDGMIGVSERLQDVLTAAAKVDLEGMGVGEVDGVGAVPPSDDSTLDEDGSSSHLPPE